MREQCTNICQADIRYHMLQMAVCKTGHKVLFSSQVNHKDVHVNLLEQTDCNILLSGLGVHVGDILAARPMKHVVIPELDVLLDKEKAAHYPYEKTFDEAKNDPYVILHTSGTTGMPVRTCAKRQSCLSKLVSFCVWSITNTMFQETNCLEPRLHGDPGPTSTLR